MSARQIAYAIAILLVSLGFAMARIKGRRSNLELVLGGVLTLIFGVGFSLMLGWRMGEIPKLMIFAADFSDERGGGGGAIWATAYCLLLTAAISTILGQRKVKQ
jgi:hypothetical protein